jgi:hypothetical protein
MSTIVQRPGNFFIISASKNSGEIIDLEVQGDIILQFQNFKIGSLNTININNSSLEDNYISSVTIFNSNVKYDIKKIKQARSISFIVYYDGEHYHITQDLKLDGTQTTTYPIGQFIYGLQYTTNNIYNLLTSNDAWYWQTTKTFGMVTKPNLTYNTVSSNKFYIDNTSWFSSSPFYDGDYITYIVEDKTQSALFRINVNTLESEIIDVPEKCSWLQYEEITSFDRSFSNPITKEFAITHNYVNSRSFCITWGTFDNPKTLLYPWGEPASLNGTAQVGTIVRTAVSNGNLAFFSNASSATNGTGVYFTSDGENFTKVINDTSATFFTASNGAVYCVGTSSRIYISTDNLQSFQTINTPQAVSSSVYAHPLEYINGVWVLITNNNGIYTSTDLTNWVQRTSAYSPVSLQMLYKVGDILIIGRAAAGTSVQYSTDNGTTWQLSGTLPNAQWAYFVKLSNGTYVLMSLNSIATSQDLSTFTTVTGLTAPGIFLDPNRGCVAQIDDKLYFRYKTTHYILFDGINWSEDKYGAFMNIGFIYDGFPGKGKYRIR